MRDVCEAKLMSGEMPDGPVYEDCMQNAVNYYHFARMHCEVGYELTCEDTINLEKLL